MANPDQQVLALLRPEVLALTAYHVPDASGLVKLDAMENPYPWPEAMIEEWLESIRAAALNRYPDPAASRLKSLLRTANGIPEGAELMLGNGSDELIQIVLMALAGNGAPVMAPEPTFVMYRQIASTLGLRFVGVPLKEDFSLDGPAMAAAIEEHRPSVIFLAYPNNPTGNCFDRHGVLDILRQAPGLVVLDEAYAPFADDSFMGELAGHPHLLVMRTLSKLGLAGLRLGFLCGTPAWIHQLDKLRLPYNINVLSQLSAEFALSRPEVFEEQVGQIRRQRSELAQALSALPGVRVYPSQTNFITIRLLGADAGETFRALKDAGILIKNLSSQGGPLQNCLRITVGTAEENQQFIFAFRSILNS